LGIVIVGGIMFSLILTLFVIPAMYSFLSSKKKKNALEQMDEVAGVKKKVEGDEKVEEADKIDSVEKKAE